MAITSAVSDLFSSIYELFASVFGAIYAILHSAFSAVVGLVTGLFQLVADVLGGVAEMAGGVGKFLLGNIVLIAVGGLIAFAFMRYTAQGQRVVQTKKTN